MASSKIVITPSLLPRFWRENYFNAEISSMRLSFDKIQREKLESFFQEQCGCSVAAFEHMVTRWSVDYDDDENNEVDRELLKIRQQQQQKDHKNPSLSSSSSALLFKPLPRSPQQPHKIFMFLLKMHLTNGGKSNNNRMMNRSTMLETLLVKAQQFLHDSRAPSNVEQVNRFVAYGVKLASAAAVKTRNSSSSSTSSSSSSSRQAINGTNSNSSNISTHLSNEKNSSQSSSRNVTVASFPSSSRYLFEENMIQPSFIFPHY